MFWDCTGYAVAQLRGCAVRRLRSLRSHRNRETAKPRSPAKLLRFLHPHRRHVSAAKGLAVTGGAGEDAVYVRLRLAERRHAAEALHISFAGVVRGERRALIGEAIEKIT